MSKQVNKLWWTRATPPTPLWLAALLILAACAHQIQTVATSSTKAAPTAGNIGCVEFSRLTFSRLHDTPETIIGIKAYDKARDAVCGKGK